MSETRDHKPGPLTGLKVIELAGLGPCPLAGQMLSDLGAEVTVVERKVTGARPADIANRGKASIVLDLKSPKGIALLLAMAEASDVLIEGYRPGVIERLGLGPDALLARNPGLVIGRVTGWGQSGPLAQTAGHDLTYLAMTGALYRMGEADRPPMPPLNLVADYGAGTMMLLFGVMAAIFECQRTGRGQVVDAAMVDGVAALSSLFDSMAATGQWQAGARESNMLDGGAPYYRVYCTKDGGYFALAAIEPQFFAEFVEKSGIDPALAGRRDDAATWSEQRAAYAHLFLSRTRDEWDSLLTQSDACAAPVLSPSEALNHPHIVDRNNYYCADGVTQPRPFPRFVGQSLDQPHAPLPAGSSAEIILMRLGLDASEINALTAEGVVTLATEAVS